MGLELKKGDQIIIAVDKSGSMGEVDPKCEGVTRYAWMQETLRTYVNGANKFDPDGVSLIFFAQRAEVHSDVSTTDEVDALIKQHRPGGSTNTALAIDAAWKEHTDKKNASTFLLIFTDGDATDRDAVAKSIVDITNKISDPEEFRIVFLPIGTVSADLQAFLEFLDDGLTAAKFDIVAVQDPETADFESALTNAIGSTTTSGEAAAGGGYAGKPTTTV